MYNKEYNKSVIKYASKYNIHIPKWKGLALEHYQPKGFHILHDKQGLAQPLADYLEEQHTDHEFDDNSINELRRTHGPYSIKDNEIKAIRPIYKEIYNSNQARYNDDFPHEGDNFERVNNILTHLVEHHHNPISYIHLDNIPESTHHTHYDNDEYTTELPTHNHEFKVSGEHYLADLNRNHLSIHHVDYIPEHVHTKLKEIEDTR